jgi:hypothetical protein
MAWAKIKVAEGALLAPDALLPDGWLGHLTALVRLAPNIWLVGVMTNLAQPPQSVGKLPYRLKHKDAEDLEGGPHAPGPLLNLAPVDSFPRDWREKHRGQSFEAQGLGGPCLFFKAEVQKKIDLTRCGTSFGALDGDLVGQQVRQAGYRLGCCQDPFVHHLGNQLFVALRVEAPAPTATP